MLERDILENLGSLKANCGTEITEYAGLQWESNWRALHPQLLKLHTSPSQSIRLGGTAAAALPS